MLVENVHLTKRYDDLAQLLPPQLEKLISIIDKNRFCDKIANTPRISNRETPAEYAHELPELTNHSALAHASLCLELIFYIRLKKNKNQKMSMIHY